MISDEALYKEKFGEDLDNQTAMEQNIKTITPVDAVYRPIGKEGLPLCD